MSTTDHKPVFVIAEAGVNHNGDPDRAFRLVDAAADAGADAVKFQTFSADKLALRSAPKAEYQKSTTSRQENQRDMLKKLELPKQVFKELQVYARERSIEFLSSPFDCDSLNFLHEIGIRLIKIPSGELTNGPFLWKVARTQLPIILSTGMADMAEIEQALAIILYGRIHDHEPSDMVEVLDHWRIDHADRLSLLQLTLLHCTSEYPAPLHEVNLMAMRHLATTFGTEVGYSDHTKGITIPIAAVSLGARVIEKHFTLDCNLPGPDHKASLEPEELSQMIRAIRDTELALGDGIKQPQSGERNTRLAARQQIIAARGMTTGQKIRREDLTTARCGGGLAPNLIWSLVGKTTSRTYAPGDIVQEVV
jgi:N-acetylneuraminate synthase